MKRNNIFMWAYIVFLIVSSLLRVWYSLELWPAIVLGVAISSIFFALENYCSMLHRFILNSVKIGYEVTEDAEKEQKRGTADVDNMIKRVHEIQMKSSDEEVLSKTTFVLSKFEDIKKHQLSLKEKVDSLNDMLIEQEERAKKCENTSCLLALCGFLCIFGALLFSSALVIPQYWQDILTVFSFAVILISQQLSYTMDQKVNELKISREGFSEDISLLKEAYAQTNSVIDEVTSSFLDLEEMDYAD